MGRYSALVLVVILLAGCASSDSANSSSGYFPIKPNDKYGFIDERGRIVEEPSYLQISTFAGEEWAAQKEDGTWVLLKPQGAVPLADKPFDVIVPLGLDLYLGMPVEELDYVLIDRLRVFDLPEGYKPAFEPCVEPQIEVQAPNGQYGYADRSGSIAIPPRFKVTKPFSEGLAAVVPANDEAFGYINTVGEVVIEPQFFHADNFYCGGTLTRWVI